MITHAHNEKFQNKQINAITQTGYYDGLFWGTPLVKYFILFHKAATKFFCVLHCHKKERKYLEEEADKFNL